MIKFDFLLVKEVIKLLSSCESQQLCHETSSISTLLPRSLFVVMLLDKINVKLESSPSMIFFCSDSKEFTYWIMINFASHQHRINISFVLIGRVQRASGIVDGLARRPSPTRALVLRHVLVRDVRRRNAITHDGESPRRHAAGYLLVSSSSLALVTSRWSPSRVVSTTTATTVDG
jgi:hypothetical protein